jgi:hypothetical protein
MKLNSRLLISELCAAGAAALCTAVLVVGCATGERTGRFWNTGDVSSSDAYAQAELARDRAFATNDNPTEGAPPRVATASGTQDGPNGRASISDSADSPPPPLTPPESPTTETLPPANPAAAKAGRATGAAQATGAAAGSAQLTGTEIPGTVVAPYVQKVSPSGAVDNSRHDTEIVKPRQVLARQLDPFAATDAKPFPTPSNGSTPLPPPAAQPTKSFPTPVSAGLSSADVPPPVPTGATLPAAEIAPRVVSTEAPATQGATAPPHDLVPPAVVAPAVVPPVAVAPAAGPPAVATPAQPVARASASPAAAEEFDPTLASQPPVLSAATPEPAASESPPASVASEGPVTEPAATSGAPPMELESPGEATVVVPMRPHPAVKPGDESLNADVVATHAAARRVVEPAGSQVMPPAQASAPANSYEAESHAQVNGRPCVTPPSASAQPPASATAPPTPTPATDAWESTQTSMPATPPSGNSIPTPLAPASSHEPAPPSTAAALQAPTLPESNSDSHLLRALPPTATSEQSAGEQSPSQQAKPSEPAMMTVVSDPMICDSGSVHGRYTGDESLPSGSVSHPVDNGASHKAHAVHPPASAGHPGSKSSDRSIEGKSTSFWDDTWSAPAGKHTVATADFSVPAPPPPEADDSPSGDLHANAAGADSQLALATTGCQSGSPASRAWFVIGLVAGLAVSAVVWRRWRQSDEPQAG